MDSELAALLAPSPENLASVRVFPLIPALKKHVTKTIDSPLSWDQLTASDINFAIVRPLVSKYARLRNMAVVYACLVVRSYFLDQADTELAFSALMLSRASLCEILAMKLLSHFASNYIQLVAVLTTAWNPLAGATPQVVQDVKQAIGSKHDLETAQSAIEMAISTQAKEFLATPVAQKVVNDIYSGNVVFSLNATRSILADNYKPRAIQIYDVRNVPFLNHYRLRVPRYSAILEFLNFACLMLTFVFCLANQDKAKVTSWEIAFIIFASGFTLEEYTASMEHGWIIYIANVWNSFDFTFIAIFLIYLGLRIKGLQNNDLAASNMAFDVLACGACILFPRLAFFAVSHNVVILSLRAMIVQFVFFIGIAAVCFSGLLFTLWTLSQDENIPHNHDPKWTASSIAWLMVQIWFGNTSLSFGQATSFHPLFGPILMTMFAALANTLLLTILISILSNTVANIGANATQEYLFQFAISTIEGVKSDALFSYQPPFNILAFLILKPASWFLTPRALHSFNVFLIKLMSFPILVCITVYERHLANGMKLRESGKDVVNGLLKNLPFVEVLVGSYGTSELYEAIFDMEDLSGMSEEEWEEEGNENEDEDGDGVGIGIGIEGVEREGDGGGDGGDGDVFGGEGEVKRVHSKENLDVPSVEIGGPSNVMAKSKSRSRSRPRSAKDNFNNNNNVGNGLGRRARSVINAPIPGNMSPRGSRSPRLRVHSALVPLTPATERRLGLANVVGELGYGATATATARNGSGTGLALLTGNGGDNNGTNSGSLKSPLARLFERKNSAAGIGLSRGFSDVGNGMSEYQYGQVQATMATLNSSVKKVEGMLEDVKGLPINKLKDEMKDLQERQARIESLLLMLTRGMRNDTPSSRHGTI